MAVNSAPGILWAFSYPLPFLAGALCPMRGKNKTQPASPWPLPQGLTLCCEMTFLKILSLLFLTPSEASPRVRLQGKGDATYFLWTPRWFSAHCEDGIPALVTALCGAFSIFKAFSSHELRAHAFTQSTHPCWSGWCPAHPRKNFLNVTHHFWCKQNDAVFHQLY